MKATSVEAWKAARRFPAVYPGDRPEQSYLLVDDRVLPVAWEDRGDIGSAVYLDDNGGREPVNRLLQSRGLPLLEERYPVLSYGANRNPGTIKLKMDNYRYQSPGSGLVIPTFKGILSSADVVACSVTGQGYLYADLLLDTAAVRHTIVEAWLNLLDRDQLRAMNDSEELGPGTYRLGIYPGYTITGLDYSLRPLGYAGSSPVFISPLLNSAVAFATVAAGGRTLPAMTPVAMMRHLIDCFDLEGEIRRTMGLHDDEETAVAMMKYLNGQWWYQFNSGDAPLAGYGKILALLRAEIKAHAPGAGSADMLADKGLLLPADRAYNPGEAHLLKNSIAPR